jgi:DNA polymerase III subunit alpha
LYVSDHPLSPYQKTLAEHVTHFSHQLAEVGEKEAVTVAGMVDRFRQHQTKKGNSMGFVTLEDLFGKIDLVIFPQTWEKVYHLVDMDRVLLAEGRLDTAQGDPKVLVDKLTPVSLDDLDIDLSDQGPDDDPPLRSMLREDLDDDILEDFLPQLPTDDVKPANSLENKPQDPPRDTAGERYAAAEEGKSDTPGRVAENAPDDATPQLDFPEGGDPYPDEVQPTQSKTAQVREVPPPVGFHVLKSPLPKPEPLPRADQKPRCIKITLDSCGDKQQDVRRLRRIHGILISRPGRDLFAFRVRENGFCYEISFPNVTTGLTDTLIHKLRGLMGDQNIDIAQLP